MSVLVTILAAAQDSAEHVAEGAGGHGAEEEHTSEAPFFIIGGILASFAILISVFGFKKPDFPGSASAAPHQKRRSRRPFSTARTRSRSRSESSRSARGLAS